jgi:ribonuclease HI
MSKIKVFFLLLLSFDMLYGWFDGGSRGNPGPAGGGWVIRAELNGPVIHSGNQYIGHATNNEAEYTGLIDVLKAIYQLRAEQYAGHDVEIRGDSKLLINQMLGRNAVRAENLQPLYQEAQAWYKKFSGHCKLFHVYRDLNSDADEQGNIAMDRGQQQQPKPTKTRKAPSPAVDKPLVKRPKHTYLGPVTDGRAVAVRIRRENNIIVQDCDLYVGRAVNRGGWDLPRSKWHNPISLKSCDNNATECIRRFRGYLQTRPDLMLALPELRGKRLGCWCDDDSPCHARVLAELANQ